MSPPTVRVESPVDGVADTTRYVVVDADGVPVPGPRVAVVARVHGNESVGDAVLSRLAECVQAELLAGELLAVRANSMAAALGVRHTPEGSDMNRLWYRDSLQRLEAANPATLSPEERRVRDVAPLLLGCDAILDLHSATRPAPPFLVFRDDQRHAAVAARLDIAHLVTGLHEGDILGGGTTPEVGLRPGERSRRLGFTFEAGQHDDPTNVDRAWQVTVRLLDALDMWGSHLPPPTAIPRVYEVVDRLQQAPSATDPYRFVGFEGGEPGGGRRGPPRTLASFDRVDAGEVVLRRGGEGVLRAHAPFTMLLPTPQAPPGTDLFYFARRRHGADPSRVRTDAEALSEARAVEDMLDVLADDEFGRGCTWASFDSRLLLDLCADQVGRASRLASGHPDRRILVVGRGDSPWAQLEPRVGQRYRKAMRRATAQGVDIERVQLLRGASLSWLHAMTAPTMGRLLEERAWRSDYGRIRLFLSARHPHTVSFLAIGDLERALATDEYRHVRVAILVEAATVEPVGDTAKLRIVRSGLMSARPEVVRATVRLVQSLREEHARMVRRPPFDGADLERFLDDDGALVPRSDADSRERLAELFRAVQLRQWAPPLLRAIREPERVGSGEAVGRWLAQVMRKTGVLDAASLKAIALFERPDGMHVDPEKLRSHLVDGVPFDREVPDGRAPPPAPVAAEEVVGDTYERWIGWKRTLRDVQVIPDTRGSDVDLAFTEFDIHHRVARWYDQARAMAELAPGQVLVAVAGDGLSRGRTKEHHVVEVLRAHRALLLDPHVRVLRVQHAQGTYATWLKRLAATLRLRPEGAPVGIQWEAAHGSSVNVLLVATRNGHGGEPAPFSLEGWSVERCAVVFSEQNEDGTRGYKVGLFTEAGRQGARVNPELLHFGRAHIGALLSQGGPRASATLGRELSLAVEAGAIATVTEWIRQLRMEIDPAHTPQGVSNRLDLADPALAEALFHASRGDEDARVLARQVWHDVPLEEIG